MEDIDLIFDMLLTGDDQFKVSKMKFKDYLLSTMNLREQDIDILLKTNSYLQGKDYMDKQDFRNIFEQAIVNERAKQIDEYNERLKKYQTAQSYRPTGAGGFN